MGRRARSLDEGCRVSLSLQWCGERTFAVRYRGITFYMEPSVSASDADMLTISGKQSLDAVALKTILDASPKSKVILPKAVADAAHELGIDYHRMTTTDAALRVEYFKNGEYGRVYGVPAARRDESGQPQLDWTPIGGFPQIGFMSRFGEHTVWHSGSGVPYEDLSQRLRPYSVTVAIITIGPGAFTEIEAADLAEAIEVPWLVPAPLSSEASARFVEHMLGHRPLQRFKVFEQGEEWVLPSEP